MTTPTEQPRKGTARDLFFLTDPQRWPTWPFLPVVRRHEGGEMDYGVLYVVAGVAYAARSKIASVATTVYRHGKRLVQGALSALTSFLPSFTYGD